jgi:diacylglycerol kinase family enzyme
MFGGLASMRIGLIYNRNSGEKRSHDLSNLEKSIKIIETASPYQIGPALDRLDLNESDILAIYGGDGTFQHTLTKCFEMYGEKMPAVLFFRGGTTNAVADDLKAGNSIEKTVHSIKNGRCKFKVIYKPILKLDDGKKEYGFLFGSGAAHEFIKDYSKGQKGGGKVFLLAVKMFTDLNYLEKMFREVDAEVYAAHDGKELEFNEYNIMVVSTVKSTGYGSRMMQRAGEHGKAQLRGGVMKKRDFFNNLPNKYERDIRGIHNWLVDYVRIKPKNFLEYTLDGEFKKSSEISISLKYLKTIIPQN